jgi:hypothetical protein
MAVSILPVLTSDRKLFTAEYHTMYPEADEYDAFLLYKIFSQIQYEYEIVSDKSDNFYLRVPNTSVVSLLEELKIYWIFNGVPFTDSFKQLQSFIINKNDLNLIDTDYVLLFYIFLQGEEVQDATQNLPLSMLYDMFLPVAEANLEKITSDLENKI